MHMRSLFVLPSNLSHTGRQLIQGNLEQLSGACDAAQRVNEAHNSKPLDFPLKHAVLLSKAIRCDTKDQLISNSEAENCRELSCPVRSFTTESFMCSTKGSMAYSAVEWGITPYSWKTTCA